jgi:DNA-directed RNA polymerase subunit H (RpoH/RPB5)
MSSNNKILKIYNSRKIILDILNVHQDYDIKDYENFSINEIDAMFTSDQLDMLLNHKTNGTKTYIKYYLTAKQIRPQNLDNIIEDLYFVESVLTKNDTLIIITEDEPNDTITAKMEYLYNHDGIFVVIHNIARLQFNMLEHELVPKMTILTQKETDGLLSSFNMKSVSQLPEIDRFDPQALALSLRPGQVVKIHRDSITALNTTYYRVCL